MAHELIFILKCILVKKLYAATKPHGPRTFLVTPTPPATINGKGDSSPPHRVQYEHR